MKETALAIANRTVVASCWTWTGDAAPLRGDETSPHDLRTRVRFASEAGFIGVGLVHADIDKARNEIGLDTVAKMLEEYGITYVELEFISDWWQSGPRRSRSDQVRRDLFEAAATLGAETIKVGPEVRRAGVTPTAEWNQFVDDFGSLADDARKHGVRVAIEPMPMSNLPSIIDAVRLVETVDHPAAGLSLDTWHQARGDVPFSALPEVVPCSKVFMVELSDARAEVIGELWEDSLNHRLYPGEGELDTAGFVAAIHQLGWRGPWGVEVLSSAHRSTPLPIGLERARSAALRSIDQADRLLALGSRTGSREGSR